MKPKEIKTNQDILTLFKEREVEFVHVAMVDHQAQFKGKCITRDHFLSALEKGTPMDEHMNAGDFKAAHIIPGFFDETIEHGDVPCRIVPESCREIPWEHPKRNLFFLLEYKEIGSDIDPRQICRKILDMAESMGFQANLSIEYEFMLFNETPRSIREKGYRNLELMTPMDGNVYKSSLVQTVYSDFFNELINTMSSMDINLETLHWEMGQSFAEATIRYDKGIQAIDNAAIFKTFAKAHALRNDKLLSFMSRWSNDSDGSGSHIHISLLDIRGKPVFYDNSKKYDMSDTMRHFTGGIQKLLPELFLMLAPNVNSYKRFEPGIYAPIATTWGIDNKTCALRAITGSPDSQRMECRVAGADTNPYLVAACVLGAGLWGIENKLEPSDPVSGSAWTQMEQVLKKYHFPETFQEAIDRYESSETAKTLFGERFVNIFSNFRASQEQIFRHFVTQQELEWFLELT